MMKKAVSLCSIFLCVCMLLAGCGGNEPTTSVSSSGSDALTPGVDASTVSGSTGGDVGDELDNSDIIASTTTQGGATTTPVGGQGNQGGQVANTTVGTTRTYKTYPATDWPMPQRTLTNKKITRFVWTTALDQDRKNKFTAMEQAYGIEWSEVVSEYTSYWDDLAKLIAADKSPDVVLLLNNDFYPRAVVKNLVQPLDDIIDFNAPFWDNTRESMEKLKWKGKTYFPVDGTNIYSLFFYNKAMFADFGIEETPRDLLEKGEWTWDNFVALANQFVTFEADGITIKTAGFAAGPDSMHVTTGVSLVEYDEKAGYKINLKDAKLARYFNMMHDLGLGGTKAWMWPGYWYLAYDKGQVAMMTSEPWTWTQTTDMSDATRANTDVVPLPLMEKGGQYYWQVNYSLSASIPVGAKNVEGAALYIEFFHWTTLGTLDLGLLNSTVEKNAYKKKFNIKNETSTSLSKSQVEWLQEMMATYKGEYVDMMWQSWKGDGDARIDAEYEIYKGESWSSVLAKLYPKWNASIKLIFRQ